MCAICGHRPVKGGHRFCTPCQDKIDKDVRSRKADQPVKYATYRGHVVGFYHDRGNKLVPKLLMRKAESLPKGRTIDLNHYCDGYTRDQVKKIKHAILQLAQV